MKLGEIHSFVAVAEEQSVKKAAKRLNLTQSAVSRLIQRLEDEVGVTFFDRSNKPLKLTKDGQIALLHCRRVLQHVDEFQGVFSEVTMPKGTFRLGVSYTVGALAACEPLQILRESFPALTVQFRTDLSDPLLSMVAEGTLDGAIITLGEGISPPQELNARYLGREGVQVVGSKGLKNPPKVLRDMNKLGWVLQPTGCGHKARLESALHNQDEKVNIAVEANGQDLQLSLVARGIGLGLVPMKWLERTPHVDQLRVLPANDFSFDTFVWLVQGRYPGRLTGVFDELETCLLSKFDRR